MRALGALPDLCAIVTDGTHDSPKLQPAGVPFIKGKHISGGRVDFSSCDYITEEDHAACVKRIKPQRGDILFSNIGSIGDTAVVDSDVEFSIKNIALFRPDPKKADPRYVYYLVCSEAFRAGILNQRSGAAQPFISLANLRSFEFAYEPDLPTQRRIAGILSAYDDLIENNLRRIRILEEMAQSLYREWFVHFRFPRDPSEDSAEAGGHESVPLVDSPLGPIPEGWEVKKLLDYADVIYGFAFKSRQFNTNGEGEPVVRIRDIPNGKSETFTLEEGDQKHRIQNGDILVGMDGDFHMAIWSGGEAWQNQRVAKFRSKGEIGNNLLFHVLEAPIQHFNATITGTTVAHLGDKHIKTIEFAAPPIVLLRKASKALEPFAQEALNLRLRNQTLRQTRNLLLPKLLNGS